jgi:hypothetical protein
MRVLNMKPKRSKLSIFITTIGILFFLVIISIVRGKIQLLDYRIEDSDDQYVVYRVMNDEMTNYEGLMDFNGNILYKAKYTSVQLLDHYIILVDEDDIRVVSRDEPKKVLIKEKKFIDADHIQYGNYYYYYPFEQGTIFLTANGHYLIDHTSHQVDKLDQNWDRYLLNSGSDERVIYQWVHNKQEWYGIMDFAGNTVVEPIYNYITPFTDQGYAFAAIGDKTDIIDIDGKIIKSLDHSLKVDVTHPELTPVHNGKNYGVITIDGEVLIDLNYDYVYLHQQFIAVVKDDLYGIYSLTGETLFEPIYDSLSPINIHDEPFAKVELDGKQGVIDLGGEILIPIMYENIHSLHIDDHVLLKVEKGDKWALFDRNGKQLTDFIYDTISSSPIQPQWIIVNKNEQIGILNSDGKQVTEIKYDYIVGTVARFTHDAKTYYEILNDVGEVIYESESPIRYNHDLNLIVIQKDGMFGVVNLEQEIVISCKYDEITYFNGYFWLTSNGKAYRGTSDGDVEMLKSRDLYISWFW